jgi:ribose/xylose/arabinose/galactoside ABC-type transport system permease subunit
VFVLLRAFAGDSGMFNAQGILNWSTVSAQFMIIAVGACMLMIAGEFDLSVGSMIGFAGMMIAIFSVTLGGRSGRRSFSPSRSASPSARSTAGSWCAPGCQASS